MTISRRLSATFRRDAPRLCAAMLPLLAAVPVHAAPPPVAGAAWAAICRDVGTIQGGDRLLFTCLPAGAPPLTVAVAFARDRLGRQLTPDEVPLAAEADHARQAAVATVITAFIAIKAANPGSAAVLELSGLYSRLPASAGVACVDNATLRR